MYCLVIFYLNLFVCVWIIINCSIYFLKGVKRRLNLETLNFGYEDVSSTPMTAKRMRKWSNSSAGSESPSPAQSGIKTRYKCKIKRFLLIFKNHFSSWEEVFWASNTLWYFIGFVDQEIYWPARRFCWWCCGLKYSIRKVGCTKTKNIWYYQCFRGYWNFGKEV